LKSIFEDRTEILFSTCEYVFDIFDKFCMLSADSLNTRVDHHRVLLASVVRCIGVKFSLMN